MSPVRLLCSLRRQAHMLAVAVLPVLALTSFATHSAATLGQWTPNRDWSRGNSGRYAVHLMLLPGDDTPHHSRIVFFNGLAANGDTILGGQWGWKPGQLSCTAFPDSYFVLMNAPSFDMHPFCSGHSMLPSGNVLISGGTHRVTGFFGENTSRILTRGTGSGIGSWSIADTMSRFRWYPTTLALRNGRVLSISGLTHRQHRMFGGFRNGAAPASDTLHRYAPIPSGTWDPAIVPTPPVSGPPQQRYAHSVVSIDGIFGFVGQTYFGGRTANGDALNDTWSLQVDANYLGADRSYKWVQITPEGESPAERSDHASIAVRDTNRSMVIYGGLDQDSTALGNVWRLYRTTGTFGVRYHWQVISPFGTAPPARFGHTAIYDDTLNASQIPQRRRMIVVGGCTSPGGALADTSVWELRFHDTDPTVATWYRMPQIDLGHGFPAARYWHTMNRDPVTRSHASKNANVALMFGGRLANGSDSGELWSMWIFRDNTIGWQRRDTVSSTNPPHARSRHSAAYDISQGGGRLYVYGGQRGSIPADSSAFIVDTWTSDRTWKQWQNLGFSLAAHTAAPDPSPNIARTPELYDPGSDTWTMQSNLNLFEATYPPSFHVPGGTNDSSRVINLNRENFESYWTNVPASGQAGPWRRLTYGSPGFRAKTGVQYRPGKIMIAGGDNKGSTVIGRTMTLDLSNLENSWTVTDSMLARTHHNLVLLPTGQVLAVGGNNDFNHVSSGP